MTAFAPRRGFAMSETSDIVAQKVEEESKDDERKSTSESSTDRSEEKKSGSGVAPIKPQ